TDAVLSRRAHIRSVLPLAIALTTAGAFYLVFRRTGAGVMHVAARPNWLLLGAAFVVWAGVQPLRAWAWSSTLRAPCGFRAVYAASAIGSFLDTVLPGRLGEGSKVAVLRVSAGSRTRRRSSPGTPASTRAQRSERWRSRTRPAPTPSPPACSRRWWSASGPRQRRSSRLRSTAAASRISPAPRSAGSNLSLRRL